MKTLLGASSTNMYKVIYLEWKRKYYRKRENMCLRKEKKELEVLTEKVIDRESIRERGENIRESNKEII